MPSVSVKDVDQQIFVRGLAQFLKKSGKLKVPDLVDIVKTAIYKELAPADPDWYYTRTASIARHLYIRAPAGVSSFTKIYGGRKRRGAAPAHFCRSSATVIRKALQSLEGLKLIEKDQNGGRKLTSQGRKDLDRIASQIHQKTSGIRKRREPSASGKKPTRALKPTKAPKAPATTTAAVVAKAPAK